MRQPPQEAQSQAARALVDAANTVGLRLTKQRAGELEYGPRLQFPFVRILWHKLQGERMTVTFSPAGDGGSQVTIRGGVARDLHPLASDPAHWTEALGGSTAARG